MPPSLSEVCKLGFVSLRLISPKNILSRCTFVTVSRMIPTCMPPRKAEFFTVMFMDVLIFRSFAFPPQATILSIALTSDLEAPSNLIAAL